MTSWVARGLLPFACMTPSRLAVLLSVFCLSLACRAASAQTPPDQWPPVSSAAASESAPPSAPGLAASSAYEVRLQTRYRRLRTAGAVIMVAYLPATLGGAAAFSSSTQCGSDEDFCILEFDYGPALGLMAALLSPVLVVGSVSLGIGVRRGRELGWRVPRVAVGPHGVHVMLAASF